MTVDVFQLREDQDHFDSAWDAREASRHSLGLAREFAGGNQKSQAAIGSKAKEDLARMGSPDEPVAFGRIDDDEEATYIGKHAILSADKDVLVVGWQSKAAQPFYNATISAPMGLVRKRQFKTEKNTILGVQDTVFRELKEQLEELTANERMGISDALLADLEKSRTHEMDDIVATIHQSQYHLIERPLNELLIIQGGPGTGKTAVALHRVSWLLFNERERLSGRSVLVVGPNKAFTRYIRGVLPSLGDSDISHTSLTELGPQQSTGREEPEDTAGLKGQTRMAGLLQRALWNRLRPPSDDVVIQTLAGPRRVVRGRVAHAMSQSQGATYLAGRDGLRTFLNSEVRASLGRPEPLPNEIDNALERLWPSLTPQRFLQELLGSRPQITAAGGDDFTAGDIERLYRTSAPKLSAETWSDADVALLDEAQALISGTQAGFSHIVVDEAQDLSPMQLRSLHRRSSNGSFTIVGDIAQATGMWPRQDWNKVVEILQRDGVPVVLEELEYGYRVPRQVYDIAEPLLAHIAPSLTPPRVVRDAPEDPRLEWCRDEASVIANTLAIAKAQAARGRFVGVIVPESLRDDVAAAFDDDDVKYGQVRAGELGQSLTLMTAVESKGIEFDSVVLVEPAAISGDTDHGRRQLYIALTRTTKYLSVIYSKAIPDLGLNPGVDHPNSSTELRSTSQTEHEPGAAPAESASLEPDVLPAEPASIDPAYPLVSSKRTTTSENKVNSLLTRYINVLADDLEQEIKGVLPGHAHGLLLEELQKRLAPKEAE